MQLKNTTPVPSSRFSLNKKLKTGPISIRGSSQTPTLRKKFSPHLNKSFNCYEEASVLPSYSRNSPSILRETITIRRTKNRLRVSPKVGACNLLPQIKTEMLNKNYRKALDLINLAAQVEAGVDLKYFRGVCFLHLKMYSEALNDLKTVQELNPSYDPQLYVAVYMCHMYLTTYPMALKALNNCIKLFPNYSKAFLLRGQMLNKMKKYEKALRDFRKTSEEESCLYIGQSLKGLRQYQTAIGYLEKAEKVENFKNIALVEKAKIWYKLGKIQDSKNILITLIDDGGNYQVYYYLSKIHIKEGDLTQAGLFLEQITQYSQDQGISLRAICKIALIMIKERDYYGALHNFYRASGKLYSKNKRSLFQYTEAVVSLMKRKFSEGIKILTTLIEENTLKDYIVNCLIFRAYGLYASGNYELCISDYTLALKSQPLDKASEFNFSISKSMISSTNSPLKQSLDTFKSLQSQFPKNPIAEICQVVLLINSSITDQSTLLQAEKIMQAAGQKRTDSEVLYIKAIISYFQSNFDQAYTYIKECIDKAEENVFSHYLVRGFCNLTLKIYQEAVQDFSISLQLNESAQNLYPYRGICGYLSEDYNLALDDFLFFCNDRKPENVLLSAKLLLFTACYTDALMLISNSVEDDEIVSFKAYCYLMTDDIKKAISCLKRVKGKKAENDLFYIEKLVKGEVGFCGEGSIFTKKYSLWLKGLQLMFNKQYTEAVDVFQDVLEIMHSSENDLFNDNIIIEEENCEVLYNIALCNTLSEQMFNREHALLIMKELAEVVNVEHRGQLFLICAIIELSQNNKDSAEKYLKESAKCAPEHCQAFLDGNPIEILPLHTGNEFSSKFPLIEFFANKKVRLRPAVTLPKFLPPLKFEDSCQILKDLLKFETILPRPEAPWLNRNKGSIQFTESIIDLDIEDSKRNSKKMVFLSKPCKSQEIRKKNSSFVKVKDLQKDSKINNLMDKIKEICS